VAIRATISLVQLQASTASRVPAAHTYYRKYALTDFAVVSDSDNKRLRNTVTLDDVQFFATSKLLVDDIAVTEFSELDINKPLSDIAQVTEAVQRNTHKLLSDASSTTDQYSLTPIKVFGESLELTDGVDSMSLYKRLQDTAVITDDLDGAASTLDEQTIHVTKVINSVVPITDKVIAATTFRRTLFPEYTSVSSGPVEIEIVKAPILEFMMTRDYYQMNTYKVFLDQPAITSAGLITNQSYCNPDYLAEDYVGASVRF